MMIKATKRVNPPAPYNQLDAYELPECEEFPGGGIAFSSRGAVSALTGGGGAERPNIERYARGMLAESGSFEIAPVEFVTPDGGSICRGIMLETFVEIVQWYAHKHALGTLHPTQRAIGRTCALLQNVAARLGWETMARSWFGRVVAAHEVPVIQAAALLRERTKWERFYPWSLAEALSKFVNVRLPFDRSAGWPAFMGPFHRALHVILLGERVAEEARLLRDEVGNETIHQGFSSELKEAIHSYLPMLITVAELSDTKEQWLRSVALLVRRRRESETPFGERMEALVDRGHPAQQSFADLLGVDGER